MSNELSKINEWLNIKIASLDISKSKYIWHKMVHKRLNQVYIKSTPY